MTINLTREKLPEFMIQLGNKFLVDDVVRIDIMDNDWTYETPKNKQAYNDSVEGKNEGYSIVDAKKLLGI